MAETHQDILDVAVTHIANDDYNHIPETTLRQRLAAFRGTHRETALEELADIFIQDVRYSLTERGDPEYGETTDG